MEHMVEMIGKSPLAALFDLRGIDWEKCERQALDSYVKQVCALYAQGIPPGPDRGTDETWKVRCPAT